MTRRHLLLGAAAAAALLSACGTRAAHSGTAERVVAPAAAPVVAKDVAGDEVPVKLPQVCAARDHLRGTLAALVAHDLVGSPRAASAAAVGAVQSDVDVLVSGAPENARLAALAMGRELVQLQSGVRPTDNGGVQKGVVGPAMQALNASAKTLFSQLQPSCP